MSLSIFPVVERRPPPLSAPSYAPSASAGAELLLAGLEALPHGIALVDAQAQVLAANRAARAALKRLEHGSAEEPPQDNAAHRWQLALARVCKTDRRELFELPARCGMTFAALVPIQSTRGTSAFVTFGRHEMCSGIELQMFALRYGLTHAETQVLKMLCLGHTANEIASAHDVAVSTVLTQIAAVRNKTMTGSIRSLLTAMSRMPPMASAVYCSALD